MSKRVFLAALAGGVAMFIWASIAHMALPLGQAGISEIPNEGAVLQSMQSSLGSASGLYIFPGMNGSAEMKVYETKLASNPSGMLIYHPPGAKALTPGQLVTEFLTEFVETLLLAWLLLQTRIGSFGGRLGFALAIGVVAGITTNISYWNWYGFPTTYTLVYAGTEIAGFLVAGAVIAKFLGKSAATA